MILKVTTLYIIILQLDNASFLFQEWLRQLLSTLQWNVPVNEDTQYNIYKVLPVFRPSDNIHVIFTSLPTTSHDNNDVITNDINTELQDVLFVFCTL